MKKCKLPERYTTIGLPFDAVLKDWKQPLCSEVNSFSIILEYQAETVQQIDSIKQVSFPCMHVFFLQ